MSNTVMVTIDGRKVEAPEGSTILDVARREGIHIPTLCYSHLLRPLENCRLCVVAVEGEKQYKAACSTPVADGMVIRTTGEELAQTRKLLLELLLDTHYGDCVAPCTVTCPANVDIQGYLALIRHGEYLEAVRLIKEKIPMPATIGRVCPHPCESACRRHLVDEPVNINHCKRFVADFEMKSGIRILPEVPKESGRRVAIIGGGPAGLSAAYYLRALGHGVTIFESREKLGGMLRYGIPEYRLPKKILDWEIDGILSLGVEVKTGVTWGRDFTLDDLKKEGFDAIFLAIGAWASRKLGIVGEELEGVESGVDFLENIAAGKAVRVGRRVAVIGGGNVAIDAARSALRLGAEKVTILYRRSRKEMPASHEEIEAAEAEGVEIHLLAAPTRVLGENGRVTQLEFIRMELGEPDASGRRRPVPIEGSETIMNVDQVIAAIGQYPKVLTPDEDPNMDNIPITRWSTIGGDPRSMHTGTEMIFVGGDLFRGPMTVVAALADGRKAAYSLNRYFQVGEVQPEPLHFNISKGDLETIDKEPFGVYKVIPRERMPELEVAQRISNFLEVELGFDEEQAHREAERCLVCGCSAAFDCRLRELMNEFQVDWRDQPSKKIHFQRVAAVDTHPVIALDPNKCIRCERCYVACQTLQCSDAIEFKDWPRFNDNCTSCGLCVDLCPTGALMERRQGRAVERLDWSSVPTHCIHCGCACEVDLKVKGDRLVWIADGNDVPPNHASTCSKGRFKAYDDHWRNERITVPMIRENGQLKKASWGRAIDRILQGFQSISEKHGSQAIGALLSPRTSCEGIYLLQKWMRLGLKTPNVDFPGRLPGEALADALLVPGIGWDLVAPISKLSSSRQAVWFTFSPETAPVVATFLRRAFRIHNASIHCVSHQADVLTGIRSSLVQAELERWPDVLSVLAAAVHQERSGANLPARVDSLVKEVLRYSEAAALSPSDEATVRALAKSLAENGDASIIVDFSGLAALSADAVRKAAQSAVLLAFLLKSEDASPWTGLYPVFSGVNTLGALLMGASPTKLPGWRPAGDDEALGEISKIWEASDLPPGPSAPTGTIFENGKVKGLFVQESRFLESRAPAWIQELEDLEFLVVQENVPGALVERADVVLPLAAFGEQSGTLVNQEGRLLTLNKGLASVGEALPDWEAASRIMAAHGVPFPRDLSAVYEEWNQVIFEANQSDWVSLAEKKMRLADLS